MGVRGLTTYLREHRHTLAKAVQLDLPPPELRDNTSAGYSDENRADKAAADASVAKVKVVVDGWS